MYWARIKIRMHSFLESSKFYLFLFYVKDLRPPGSFPKCPQQSGLGQIRAENPEFYPRLSWGWWGPKCSSCYWKHLARTQPQILSCGLQVSWASRQPLCQTPSPGYCFRACRGHPHFLAVDLSSSCEVGYVASVQPLARAPHSSADYRELGHCTGPSCSSKQILL